MEESALVYIILTAVTVAFGFLVKNRDYTTEYLSGRRSFRGNTSCLLYTSDAADE